MQRKRLIYEARTDGVTAVAGTAKEIADFLGVAESTIRNCEITGRKIHGTYEIERRSKE